MKLPSDIFVLKVNSILLCFVFCLILDINTDREKFENSIFISRTVNVTVKWQGGGVWVVSIDRPLKGVWHEMGALLCSSCRSLSIKLKSTVKVQGGSDISGKIFKFHRRIKKSTFLRIISRQTVSALFRSGNKNKQTHSSKNKSTRSYETCHSLQASRCGWTMTKSGTLKTSKRALFKTL